MILLIKAVFDQLASHFSDYSVPQDLLLALFRLSINFDELFAGSNPLNFFLETLLMLHPFTEAHAIVLSFLKEQIVRVDIRQIRVLDPHWIVE